MSRLFLLGASAALSLLAASARAEIQPEPLPPAPPIALPRDVPYPGVLKLSVDATDLDHAIFTMHETVPVAGPGPLVLLYPRWLPGNHSPSGPIDKLASLKVSARGQPLTWTRDPVDVYAFHVDVPADVGAVDVDFQYLSAVSTREGHVDMSRDMLALEWNAVALYPAGYFTRDIRIDASVTLPKGFTPATALETAATDGQSVSFKTTTFNTLVDSPLMAGRYFKTFDLDPGGPARVTLDVMADAPEDLEVTPEQLQAHKNLVQQAYKLYASHHYDHYDFLLWLSDKIGGAGLEHHQSSEDGTAPNYFVDWDKGAPLRDLLAHEYTHSWNGKFRRPADLWTPSFNVPMRDSLLWVYEGQTQYWGYVLAARAGLLTKQQALDAIASTAASYDHVIGRTWRDLEDTTNDPIIAERRPLSWRAWERSEDYYSEGELIWLDADTLIRKLSGGKHSLDDFAADFFGVRNGSFVTDTYTFDDVVAALNAVQPYDWAKFLHDRLDGHGPGAPLDGLARGGYRLVYTDTPTAYFKEAQSRRKIEDLSYSIGLAASTATPGTLSSVLWDGPAFKAGMTQADKIIAVNGEAFTVEGLKAVVARSKSGSPPISLILENKNQFRTVSIPYEGGLRYPRLERAGSGPASLDAILAPKP
jgi:predicted metalloprotease with PDZ domain